MFVENEYKNFKYLVSAENNYVILTNQSYVNADWQNQKKIDVIYKYINPSILTIEGQKTYTNTQYFERIETTDNFFERADCLSIINTQLYLILFFCILFNGLTRFVKKGGVIFGD